MKQKLSKKNYQRIPNETFEEWITEIMKEPTMRYANAPVVAVEIEKRYGGLSRSHLYRIYGMRIDVQDYLTEK